MSLKSLPKIERMYKIAQREIEKDISRWYSRIAKNNNIRLSEARKLLSKDELAEFKWDVNEYIKRGQENALDGRWMKELENASAKYHISRLEALKINVENSLQSLTADLNGTVTTLFHENYQSAYYHTAFELQRGFRIGFDIGTVDQSRIDKVLAKPWAADGYNFSERLWKNKQKLIGEVHNQLTQNLLTGGDPQKAINAIAKKLNASKNNAARLVMTESAYFSSLAQGDCYRDLGVEEFEIVATLDAHTSEVCREMDGQHFPMKDFQAGVTAPPFHPWCRSTTVPYFAENFGVVGMRAARDEDGKTYYVPADMTYKEWEKAFVDGDKSGLTNDQNGGIIGERNNATITEITDSAVDKVPYVELFGYTDEQCVFIQQQHIELLKYARDTNNCKEVSFVFNGELNNRKEFKGSDDKIAFGNVLYGKDLFVMHNHPRNNSFSDSDIVFLLGTDNLKTLSIVKNNGSVEVLTKTTLFNKDDLILDFKRQYKKYVKTGLDSEIDKAVQKFIARNKEGLEWKVSR